MARIFLLTAPFDEEAKTGDGQYAASLEQGFKEHYQHVSCKWLKQIDGKYSIPLPTDSTSIPPASIPSAFVLQPVANGNTVISGYKLNTENTDPNPANLINIETVSPRTPKILLKADGRLHTFTLMDMYTRKPVQLDQQKVDDIFQLHNQKYNEIQHAIYLNKDELSKRTRQRSKISLLKSKYEENPYNIQKFCTLNEYIEAHLEKEKFDERFTESFNVFFQLRKEFLKSNVDLDHLERLSDKLTGIQSFVYDFKNNTLPYDVKNDSHFVNMYDYDGLISSVDTIVTKLSLYQYLIEKYPNSFRMLVESTGTDEYEDKLAFINFLYEKEFKQNPQSDNATFILNEVSFKLDKESFINFLLNANEAIFISAQEDKIPGAIEKYKEISDKLSDIPAIKSNTNDIRIKIPTYLQDLISKTTEPYLSANQDLDSFYTKRDLSHSVGFHMAFNANKNDSLKPQVIANIIDNISPIDEDTYLDIHIRPPDCGVFITPQDIKQFQQAGIKVNLTIHEYKQNYTRRHLQQYTHGLMREADFVQFFNQLDRDNAIIASEYGDCDKRNTTEESGVAKKIREVGVDVDLDKYPVETYDLRSKSGLTVASQKLSDEPAHPKDVLAKAPNILSFGTIRPGKGFEEALKLARLIKENQLDIRSHMKILPVVKLAGDPQDAGLMQKMVNERFGEDAVSHYQNTNPYNIQFTNSQRRDYWKNLVKVLNTQFKFPANPFIEIYPWCEPNELLEIKNQCKYVCRMDDMGMRNNGSAIISVLDVGIVYTKFGSVTDPIFVKPKGKYCNAVDIGEHRYGKYNLILKEERLIQALKPNEKLKPLLSGSPDSIYKRLPESRDPQDILDSIVEREMNQLEHFDDITQSQNYQTVLEVRKLLTERFTLQNSAKNLLVNMNRSDLLVSPELEDDLFDLDPVEKIEENLQNSPEMNFGGFYEPYRPSQLSMFTKTCSIEYRLKSEQESTNINRDKSNCSLV